MPDHATKGIAVTRDPRIEPIPGDAICRLFKRAKGGSIIREVERAHGGFVGFYYDNGYVEKWRIVSLRKWQRWAKSAEILEARDA